MSSMVDANGLLFLVSLTCCIGEFSTSFGAVSCFADLMGANSSALTLSVYFSLSEWDIYCLGNFCATPLNFFASCFSDSVFFLFKLIGTPGCGGLRKVL